MTRLEPAERVGSAVRYKDGAGIAAVLEVVTPGRRSVLALVRRLLHRLRVQIVRVESVVREEAIEERFHVVELDGAPLARRRAAALRSAVRKAVREAHDVAA